MEKGPTFCAAGKEFKKNDKMMCLGPSWKILIKKKLHFSVVRSHSKLVLAQEMDAVESYQRYDPLGDEKVRSLRRKRASPPWDGWKHGTWLFNLRTTFAFFASSFVRGTPDTN